MEDARTWTRVVGEGAWIVKELVCLDVFFFSVCVQTPGYGDGRGVTDRRKKGL